jgi:hypothetical protein
LIAQSFLLLLIPATMSGAATTRDGTPFTSVLTYTTGSRSAEASRTFRSRGKTYRFRLNQERDVGGNLVVFELVMEGRSRSPRGPNLLDPTGTIHGYQKWDFAASDFAHGPKKSLYGSTRTIDLPKLGLAVRIEVVRSAVEPAPTTPPEPATFRFTGLTLRILADAASR